MSFHLPPGRVRSCAISALCASVMLGAWSARRIPDTLHASDQSAPASPGPLGAGFTLEGPYTHANLTVFIVRGAASDPRAYMTLDEGLTAAHRRGA